MFDSTIKDKFAARALNTLALLDADPGASRLTRQVAVSDAMQDAMASGVAHFQASVAAGSSPRAMPHDGGACVLIALQQAGFKVTRDRSRKGS
jgi:hypothetical protein|tara:strand:- start:64 stop:342 length:279 start_codon:yes stop_codon:yes gene_type:complete